MPALTPQQADQVIRSRVAPQPAESRPLARCVGRILREDVYAERDNPPFDRVCMDGIAVASAAFADGTRRFRLQATQAAGAVPLRLATRDSAIEVMTGAVLPEGTDSIIPLEEYERSGSELAMKPEATAAAWRNVQRRGSDSRPGVPMLLAGMRLGAAEIAVAASAGLARLSVSRQQRVMVVSTGDELIEPGLPIAAHQVRRSNAYGVVAALQVHGFYAAGNDHLPDDEQLMRRRLSEHLDVNDVLVLSGGISKGKFDFVPAALKHLGVEEVFDEVAQRPARPMWFGVGPKGQAVFGLPGNPVATMVCLSRYVLPAMTAAMGAGDPVVERIAMGEAMGAGRRMTYFMPVALQADEAQLLAFPRPPNGPGDFLALSGTDGFVELPPSAAGYPRGFIAHLYRW
ncbi:MAG TPA: molybdopterin molybdotransferase MoeA [Steroidobacteraceae bacterium]|jgi:molybdopterin molybdotransferase|nr:molybdopterin molybdotransferase MoeA [Steroidobacteraceae bacterium]